jgi:hypothetical protein
LDTSDALADMVQALLDKLPEQDNPAPDDVREDVALMIHHYVEGAHSA